MSGTNLIIVKIGGSVIRKNINPVLNEVKSLIERGTKIVLIHGGGYFINEIMEKMGLKPKFVVSPSGVVSRYTDYETLRAYVMGMMYINKELVSRLQAIGVNAIGLSGVDACLLRAKKREHIIIIDERGRQRAIDGGYTGKVEAVNAEFLNGILRQGLIPVIAPIAIDPNIGSPLNIDGDQVLEAVSMALKPNHAFILTDVDGVIVEGKVVKEVNVESAETLFKHPDVKGGMKRKVYTAMQLAKRGIYTIITNGIIENPIKSALEGLGTHFKPRQS